MNTLKVNFNLKNPVHFLALGFGSGLIKPAPGTWGTLAAVPVYWVLATLPISVFLLVILIGFAVGIYLCGKTASDVGVHDHGAIVWDEFIGFWIAMIAIPFNWVNVLIGFILFRIFDIIKPWPIKVLDQKVHGGFGIMIDDVIAGVFACIILHLLQPVLGFS